MRMDIPESLFNQVGKLQELIKEVETTMLDQEDLTFLVEHIDNIRSLRVTPSKVGERCLDMAEDLALIRYPGHSRMMRSLLAVKLATEAMKKFGLHASQGKPPKVTTTAE